MASLAHTIAAEGSAPASRRKRALPGLDNRALWLGWFLVFALATRISVFGDTNFFHDELFYFQVGQRMHDGLLPYVDLWDRKGPGLFLTAYLVAGVSKSILAFQIAAWLSAALTALVIAGIAARGCGRTGAVVAGTLYLSILPMFGGAAAQSPVFYNLWIALAALGVVRAVPALTVGRVPWPAYAAIAGAGFALTFKQSAICEAAFLGCYVLWCLYKAKTPLPRLLRHAGALALLGAAPMLAFAAFYALSGHFAEFWHAMVTSNLTKTYNPGHDALERVTGLLVLFVPVLALAAWGLRLSPREGALPRLFLAGWLTAAIAGVAIVPNFFDHYILPVAVPASLCAARALDRRPLGTVAGLAAAFLYITSSPAFEFAERQASRAAMSDLAGKIEAHDPRAKVFIYEGPVYLYALLDRYPPTPVFYPFHLAYRAEDRTAYRDVGDEVDRVLGWRPDVVILAHGAIPNDENPRTGLPVRAYVRDNCRLLFTHGTVEMLGPGKIDVWGDCNRIVS